MAKESWIACDRDILGGKPVIRGTRISMAFVLELVASGATVDDIVAAYPHTLEMGSWRRCNTPLVRCKESSRGPCRSRDEPPDWPLLTDENVHRALMQRLVEQGHDVRSVWDLAPYRANPTTACWRRPHGRGVWGA